MEKANAAAQRLCNWLPNIDGLGRDRVADVAASLDALIRDLEEMLPEARERVAEGRAKAS